MSHSPLEFEPPATTDDLLAEIHSLRAQQERLVEAVNQIGANLQWLVANTQGLFQMFSDPNIINQMMSAMMGGLSNVGRTNDATPSE